MAKLSKSRQKKQVYFLADLENGTVEKFTCTESDMIEYLETDEDIIDSLGMDGDIRLFTNELSIIVKERKFDIKLVERK